MKFRLTIEKDIHHFHKEFIRIYPKKSLEERMNYTKKIPLSYFWKSNDKLNKLGCHIVCMYIYICILKCTEVNNICINFRNKI
jgi:hypothetical protein